MICGLEDETISPPGPRTISSTHATEAQPMNKITVSAISQMIVEGRLDRSPIAAGSIVLIAPWPC